MTPVALLQEDGEPLVIDGAMTVRVAYPGTLTSSPLPDRSYAADGKQNQPTTVTIDAIVSPNPTLQGLTQGDARLTEVRAWLQRAYADTDVMSVQIPKWGLLTDYVLEGYTMERGNTDSERLTANLKRAVIASSLSVSVTRQTTPTDDARPGLAEEDDQGTTTTVPVQSLASAFIFGAGGPLAGGDG